MKITISLEFLKLFFDISVWFMLWFSVEFGLGNNENYKNISLITFLGDYLQLATVSILQRQ
jgi:hypothetical protein